MSAELHVDEGIADLTEPVGTRPRDLRRPNVSGDLLAVLEAGPMFRRAVAGYDRFQVDTYVQWAEDELATADREREDLQLRLLGTRAALEDARQLLSHSAGGGELLGLSRRMGSLLAAAADEAASIRAEAEDHRAAASAAAAELLAQAEQARADAEAEARRVLGRAAAEAAATAAEGARILAEVERVRQEADREVAARLDEVRAAEQRAAEDADRIRREAEDEAVAVRLRARDDVVRMLGTARDERRRADDEASADRIRLDRVAAARRAVLLADVAVLEQRWADLRAELDRATAAIPPPRGSRHLPARASLRQDLDRLGSHAVVRSPQPVPTGDRGPAEA